MAGVLSRKVLHFFSDWLQFYKNPGWQPGTLHTMVVWLTASWYRPLLMRCRMFLMSSTWGSFNILRCSFTSQTKRNNTRGTYRQHFLKIKLKYTRILFKDCPKSQGKVVLKEVWFVGSCYLGEYKVDISGKVSLKRGKVSYQGQSFIKGSSVLLNLTPRQIDLRRIA